MTHNANQKPDRLLADTCHPVRERSSKAAWSCGWRSCAGLADLAESGPARCRFAHGCQYVPLFWCGRHGTPTSDEASGLIGSFWVGFLAVAFFGPIGVSPAVLYVWKGIVVVAGATVGFSFQKVVIVAFYPLVATTIIFSGGAF